MNVYTLKSYLTSIAIACLIPAVNAQFDDVYYDPDNVAIGNFDDGSYDESEYNNDDVTYYDDDEYEYYDDYDYYYTSRIRRFHHYSSGIDFYDPWYTSYSYYNPYDYDAYFYPGASIYISFGNADYWSYRNWRRFNRWNRWNSYSHWNNWYSPASYYYSYNSWCAPSYNYWGGHHGYHSYSNYYNNYYNSCPFPVSNYYGVTHTTVTNINNGNTRGSYYGPRIGGNTGSSPRGPVEKPENIQPVLSESPTAVDPIRNSFTKDNPLQNEAVPGVRPRPEGTDKNVPTDANNGDQKTTVGLPSSRDGHPAGGVNQEPVDKEITREPSAPVSKRPVFKPYPSNDRPATRSETEKVSPTPRTSTGGTDKELETPRYMPRSQDKPDRPSYTPPSTRERSDDNSRYTPKNEDRPSYTPPSRKDRAAEDRPSYTPPSRSEREEKPSYSPSQRNNESSRSNDRPSYSPPSRNDSSSGGRSASPPPSRDNSSSRSGSSGSSPRSPR